MRENQCCVLLYMRSLKYGEKLLHKTPFHVESLLKSDPLRGIWELTDKWMRQAEKVNKKQPSGDNLMPVLHTYKDRQGKYVLTRIGQNIVSYQLTFEGAKKLEDAEFKDNQNFPRALLLSLISSGDAYTHGSGAGTVTPAKDPRQLEFDFSDDSASETMIPSCSLCESPNDLHLTTVSDENTTKFQLLCPDCRTKSARDISIPLHLADRRLLKSLLKSEPQATPDETVKKYEELLDEQFKKSWEELAKKFRNRQSSLPGLNSEDDLNLS